MKSHVVGALAVAVTAVLLGCGAGHAKLSQVAVSPSAAAVTNTDGTATYTATGKFDNNTSRQLTRADGLTWATSNNAISTIDDGGTATCVGHGVVTVKATAPVDLTITISNTIDNTSPKVSGTASLNCM